MEYSGDLRSASGDTGGHSSTTRGSRTDSFKNVSDPGPGLSALPGTRTGRGSSSGSADHWREPSSSAGHTDDGTYTIGVGRGSSGWRASRGSDLQTVHSGALAGQPVYALDAKELKDLGGKALVGRNGTDVRAGKSGGAGGEARSSSRSSSTNALQRGRCAVDAFGRSA